MEGFLKMIDIFIIEGQLYRGYKIKMIEDTEEKQQTNHLYI